jgi:hypothetical protein
LSSVLSFKTEGSVYSFSFSLFIQGSGEVIHDIMQYVFRNLCDFFIHFMSSVVWGHIYYIWLVAIFIRSNIMPVRLGNEMAMTYLQSGR